MAHFSRSDMEDNLAGAIDAYRTLVKTGCHEDTAKSQAIYRIVREIESELSDCPACHGSGGGEGAMQCVRCCGSGSVEPNWE